ncbi:CoA transferase [Mesorhizobium sp. M0051]
MDFGHYVAGPAAGMILADLRAEVVSIVPAGDRVGATLRVNFWRAGQISAPRLAG